MVEITEPCLRFGVGLLEVAFFGFVKMNKAAITK